MTTSPPPARIEIYGFMSYSRDDCREYDLIGFLEYLESLINDRLTHHALRIHYDDDIEKGVHFWPTIKDLISQATLYFVFLSPSFCFSDYCWKEYQAIRERTSKNKIYVISVDRNNIPEWFKKGELGKDIFRRQFFDLPKSDYRKRAEAKTDHEKSAIYFSYMNDVYKFSKEIASFIEEVSLPSKTVTSVNPDITSNPGLLHNFRRRQILLGSLGVAGIGSAVIGGNLVTSISRSKTPSSAQLSPQQARKKVIWTMGDWFSHNQRTGPREYGSRYIASLVADMSDNHFVIMPNTDLKRNENLLDLVNEGKTIQCAYGPSYYYASDAKLKALIFGTTVPFGLNTQQQLSWLSHSYDSEVMDDSDVSIDSNTEPNIKQRKPRKVMQSLYRELGLEVVPFTAGGTGAQMGGWFKKEIPETISSFVEYANLFPEKKFRFRVAGLGGEIIRQGSEQIEIHNFVGKEIFDALNQDQLDAAEWIGPFEDLAINLNLAEGIKYYYYPGWWDPGTIYEFQVNLKAWKSLPYAYQKILQAACHQACHAIHAYYDEQNSKSLEIIQREKNILLKEFPPRLMQAMREETSSLLDRLFGFGSGATLPAQKLYQEWLRYRQDILAWHKLSGSSILR